MKNVRTAELLVSLFLLVVASSYGQRSPAQAQGSQSHDIALASLGSTNRDARVSAVDALNSERRQMATRLLDIINGTNSGAAKVDAVIVVGRNRFTEAIPSLVHHFELDDVYPPLSGGSTFTPRALSLESGPKVSDALMHIGEPAIPALLDRLAESEDTNVIARCVRVCYRIEGGDMTQVRLQQLKNLATDQQMKARIGSAITFLTGINPSEDLAGIPDELPLVAEESQARNVNYIVSECADFQGRVLTQLRLEALLAKEADSARKARIQSALDILVKPNTTKK